jgi:hypothetical protein
MNRNAEDEATAGAAARERCDLGTLRGTYLFADDGVDITQGPFAGAGYDVFDGNGNIKGVFSANSNGTITSKNSSSGTYTVNADCTGTVTFSDGSQIDLFIDPDGSGFAFVQTNPPELVASGFERRVTRKRVGG